MAARAVAGEIDPSQIDETLLNEALWTRGLPPAVDLVIRTGGELRVSNFLLWQIAYAELWFTDEYWPAFNFEHLAHALRAFGARARRFRQFVNTDARQPREDEIEFEDVRGQRAPVAWPAAGARQRRRTQA